MSVQTGAVCWVLRAACCVNSLTRILRTDNDVFGLVSLDLCTLYGVAAWLRISLRLCYLRVQLCAAHSVDGCAEASLRTRCAWCSASLSSEHHAVVYEGLPYAAFNASFGYTNPAAISLVGLFAAP